MNAEPSFLITWIEHLHILTSFRPSVLTCFNRYPPFPFGWSATIVLRRDLDVEHWIELLDPWPTGFGADAFSPLPEMLVLFRQRWFVQFGVLVIVSLFAYGRFYLANFWNPGTKFEGMQISCWHVVAQQHQVRFQTPMAYGVCGLKQHGLSTGFLMACHVLS